MSIAYDKNIHKNVSNKKLPAAANYCQVLQSYLHLLVHLAACQWSQPTKNYSKRIY